MPADDLLSYVDTPVLTRLVLNEWSRFAPVFRNRDRIKASFNALNVYRRRVAHHRPLLPFERDLISGIAGMIRNEVSIWQQAQDGPQFYARIEASQGPAGPGVPGARYSAAGVRPPIVRIGETIEITCDGWDPRGRDLEWAISVTRGVYISLGVPPTFQVGPNRTTHKWTVEADQVSPDITVAIWLRNALPYRRDVYSSAAGGFDFDDVVHFAFEVEPPH